MVHTHAGKAEGAFAKYMRKNAEVTCRGQRQSPWQQINKNTEVGSASKELDFKMIIILTVFLKRTILSLEVILSAHARTHTHTHTHTGTCTHTSILTKQLNVHGLKRAANAQGTWNG